MKSGQILYIPVWKSQAKYSVSSYFQENLYSKYPEDKALKKLILYYRTKRSDLHWALGTDKNHPSYIKNKKYIDEVLQNQGINPNTFTLKELQNLVRKNAKEFITYKDILEQRKGQP